MKTYILIPVITAVFFAAISCSEKKDTKYLGKIDSLSAQLEQIENDMNKVNIDSIFVIFQMVEQKTNALTMLIQKLPEDTTIRVNMSLHGDIHKALKKFPKAFNGFKTELKFRKEQIKKLRDDYEAGLFEDSIEFYLKTEEGEINRFKNSFNFVYNFVS